MYIAAFRISTRECDCGTLVQSIDPIQNPETIQDCTEADKKTGVFPGWCEARDYVKQPYDRGDNKIGWISWKREEVLLIPVPASLKELMEYLPDLKALRANAAGIQRAVNLAHPSYEIGTVGT